MFTIGHEDVGEKRRGDEGRGRELSHVPASANNSAHARDQRDGCDVVEAMRLRGREIGRMMVTLCGSHLSDLK